LVSKEGSRTGEYLHLHLLSDLGLGEEESSRNDTGEREESWTRQIEFERRERRQKQNKYSPKISVLVDESSELLEDLGVHGVGHHVGIGDGLSVLLSEVGLDLLEVERSHGESRSLVDGSSISVKA